MTWTERTCTENTSGFEWAFEVADSGFSEDVDGHGFGIVDILDDWTNRGCVKWNYKCMTPIMAIPRTKLAGGDH